MEDFLLSCCADMGVDLGREQALLLIRYLDLVYEKNRVLNLTSIPEGRDAVVLHLVDSLVPLVFMKDLDPRGQYLDIGCGAGFPGVPFGVATGLRGTLIDSVNKKILVVSDMVDNLGLTDQIRPKCARAEEYVKTVGACFDYVMMRAVAPLEVTLEYATPFLKDGGEFISYKSSTDDNEWAAANSIIDILGLELVSRETLSLPDEYGLRTISVWKKKAEPKIQLPRKNGLARKKPLSKLKR